MRTRTPRPTHLLLTAFVALALPACSVRKMAVNKLGDALAQGGSTYAKDDDPELVRGAVPFGLKTIESLIEEAPRHKGLLFAAASGFTQYGYAYVQQDADFIEGTDLARATELRTRARKLYLRARDYGLRGLEVDLPGFEKRLRADPATAFAGTKKSQVPLMYWTGLAWFAAISISKEDSELTADQSRAEALMRRALALDEGWEYGSIHDFYISWEGRGESVGGSFERARAHLDKAMQYGKGMRASALVNFAESVSVPRQDRAEFQRLLEQALAVDVDRIPEMRLSNLIYQKRARWLLARQDELFVE